MAEFNRPTPRQPVPPLSAALSGGGRFDLSAETPKNFVLVVFYRGLHCPICRRYLTDLDSKVEEFEMRGVSVIAVSTDNAERAERTTTEWGLKHLRIGYGLSLRMARAWGLYISTSRGKTAEGFEEPVLFPEPGIFLVRPDGTLYYSSVQTLPFSRPHFDDILAAIDYVIERNYPARGEA
jgi:peroxiredoxin